MSLARKSVRVARLVGAAVLVGVFSVGLLAAPSEALELSQSFASLSNTI